MRKHDNDLEDSNPTGYSWGRPINEVRTALNALTGTTHGELDLVYVHSREGTQRQQHLTEQAYYRCAARWADWWQGHWRDFVDDDAYSKVTLPDPIAVNSSLFELDRHTPLIVRDRYGSNVCEPWQTGGQFVFCDLDINRFGPLHPRWKAAELRTNGTMIRKWAVSEGFDLMGSKVDVNGKEIFVLEAIAGEVWRVKCGGSP